MMTTIIQDKARALTIEYKVTFGSIFLLLKYGMKLVKPIPDVYFDFFKDPSSIRNNCRYEFPMPYSTLGY